jgi:hypothetical protein
MKAIWVVLIFSLMVVSGCSSAPVKIDKNELAAIRTVSISKTVVTSDSDPYFGGQSQAMGAAFGVIGLLAVNATDPAPVQVRKAMVANKIVVPQMLRDKFVKKITEMGGLPSVVEGPADAEFRLTITKYGMSARPFHMEMQPVVAAEVQLVKADGTVIWRQSRYMNNHSDPKIPAVLLEDYMKNIELLRTGYDMACEIVADDLVKGLRVE